MVVRLRGREPESRGTSTVESVGVALVRSKKLVAEAGDSPGTQTKRNIRQ
jgi:hypothetical protein